jgi:hypothetical protein
MKFNKIGQVAVETLLIYGVALLIVMLAIGALIGFGVLDLGSLLPDDCQLGEFKCESYVVSPDGVQFELRNNFNKNIQRFNITVVGENDNEGLWNGCDGGYSTLVVQGEMTKPPVSIPCEIKVPSKKKISGVIIANVTFVGSQLPRIIKGKIRATVS